MLKGIKISIVFLQINLLILAIISFGFILNINFASSEGKETWVVEPTGEGGFNYRKANPDEIKVEVNSPKKNICKRRLELINLDTMETELTFSPITPEEQARDVRVLGNYFISKVKAGDYPSSGYATLSVFEDGRTKMHEKYVLENGQVVPR